jgi:integrase/recombinase XerD
LIEDKKHPSCTLSQFKDEYTRFIRGNYTAKYLSSVELALRKLTAYIKKDIDLSELTNGLMEKFLLHVFGYSKYSAHLYCRTLKAAMNKAIAWGYVINNPVKGIKLPKIPTKHPAFVNINDLGKIIESVSEKNVRDIIIVGFYTGMRLSEISHLKWSAVNFDSGIITVQNDAGFTTKSKHERIIPIHDKVKVLLSARYQGDANLYVFSNRGILYRQEFISKMFKKAVRQSGLSNELHFHSLRHSFASMLVQQGVSLYVVKELLGHASISTTQIYSHLVKDNLINAISVLK